MQRVTATSLASHAHFQCDLYIHQAYHGIATSSPAHSGPASHAGHQASKAAIQEAVLTSGNTWESALLDHLDRHGLLLTVKGPPLTGADIASVIELEERTHFYVTGIAFWPPRQKFVEEYARRGVARENIPNWGLAKPDLVEIWREVDGTHVWKIIDAKASKDVKTSHLVQTFFYYLCLVNMLPPSFVPGPTVAIWLPIQSLLSTDSTIFSPLHMTLHHTAIAPLVAPLSELLFKRLPSILSSAVKDVVWHFNPLCQSCPFSSACRTRVEVEGGLGKAGEVTLREAVDIRGFIKLSKAAASARNTGLGDIEDIHPNTAANEKEVTSELTQLVTLLEDGPLLKLMDTKWPASVKRVRQILSVQSRSKTCTRKYHAVRSPVLDAALTNIPQFTNRRIYTLPITEDIAIFISLIIDPSLLSSASKIGGFCISIKVASSFQTVAQNFGFEPLRHIHGNVDSLISELAGCIRGILGLHEGILSGSSPSLGGKKERDIASLPRTQFYVWSVQERDALQKHFVTVALCSDTSQRKGTVNVEDIRLCIGAICEGASLLATVFQPPVLEGALLGCLGKKEKDKGKMTALMDRLGISCTGEQTVEGMRQSIISEIERWANKKPPPHDGARRVGILPRVVVLKKELRRIVAIPVPGWWDVKETASVFGVASASRCPDESEIFRRFWDREGSTLRKGLEQRNETCRALVSELRHRVRSLSGKRELLVNSARVLNAEWVDVCRVDVLRKLFYMHQFEVLLKLQELWNSRIEACPEAPVLLYSGKRSATPIVPQVGGSRSENMSAFPKYTFELIAGTLEVAPERDRDRSFFDYILVEDYEENEGSPPEDDGYPMHTCRSNLPLEAMFDDLCVSGLVFPLNRYTCGRWEEGQPREVKDGRIWVADIQDVKLQGGRTEVALRVWCGQGSKKGLSLGKKYRLSPRLVDFNTNKVLSTLVELDLQVDLGPTPTILGPLPPFGELITSPKYFGCHYSELGTGEERVKTTVTDKEASLHRLYTDLYHMGNEDAGALILKASQRKAAQRIIRERLTVIWGPPGSGKSYTIALALLRMLEIQATTEGIAPPQQQIIFLTAMTHAAIQACLSKLRKLIGRYRCIPGLSSEWLDGLSLEHVVSGSTHSKPADTQAREIIRESVQGAIQPKTWIFAGTVYQLYTFGKRLGRGANCVVIDEAGQLGLGAASLVLRALSQNGGLWGGKVVVAGDREQLAPIFAGKYPDLPDGQRLLFGSVLDCLMGREEWEETRSESTGGTTPDESSSVTVVQLLENFRLNPDLGNFVQTIYRRAFKPQKEQKRQVATQLRQLEDESSWDDVSESSRKLLLALSSAMLGKKQSLFTPPQKKDIKAKDPVLGDKGHDSDPAQTPRAISLALIRLRVRGDPLGEVGYENHMQAEAKVAAALVQLLGKTHDSKVKEPEDDTFVACPHRVQRAAVKVELDKLEVRKRARVHFAEDEDEELDRLIREMKIDGEKVPEAKASMVKSSITKASGRIVVVDTIERLQGSEASFVICLFSHTHRGSLSTALPFLLARRRLNVAISRAKTLCVVITSDDVLQPDVSLFTDRESMSGYTFLRAFQERAWNAEIEVDL